MSDKKWVPEVGEKVRLVGINDSVEVVAQGSGDTFCAKFNDGSLTICSVSAISRDPTDEDKEVEDMIKVIKSVPWSTYDTESLKALYRAGYRKQVEPEEDMNDPSNWLDGDILICIKCSNGDFKEGEKYSILGIDEYLNVVKVIGNNGKEMWAVDSIFKFHSRPNPSPQPQP